MSSYLIVIPYSDNPIIVIPLNPNKKFQQLVTITPQETVVYNLVWPVCITKKKLKLGSYFI